MDGHIGSGDVGDAESNDGIGLSGLGLIVLGGGLPAQDPRRSPWRGLSPREEDASGE